VTEYLPGKFKALSSSPSMAKKRKFTSQRGSEVDDIRIWEVRTRMAHIGNLVHLLLG
jgi:hypothetical protein